MNEQHEWCFLLYINVLIIQVVLLLPKKNVKQHLHSTNKQISNFKCCTDCTIHTSADFEWEINLCFIRFNSLTGYNKPVNQTTFLGASATINCNYTRVKESGIKSFCREDASSYCNNLISSYDSNYTRLDRFSLRDDKQQRVYTVIISALTQQDAGKYQCSIKSGTSTSCLTEIHLYILSEYWSDFWFNVIIILVNENTFISCSL